MKVINAYIKGMIVALLCIMIIILFTFWIEPPSSNRSIPSIHAIESQNGLSNLNLVDIVSRSVDTTTLHSIVLHQGRLKVELILDHVENIDTQIYRIIPMYVALAFQRVNNIERLDVTILQGEKNHDVRIKLLQLSILAEDEWLGHEIEEWSSSNWLEDKRWLERLRIQMYFNWHNDSYVINS